MHVGLESVREALLFAGRDLNAILLGGKVANDARTCWIKVRCPEGTPYELNGDRCWLFVGEGQDGFCGNVVDEFDAKDLGRGEGGRDGDVEGGGLVGRLDFLIGDLYGQTDWRGRGGGGVVYGHVNLAIAGSCLQAKDEESEVEKAAHDDEEGGEKLEKVVETGIEMSKASLCSQRCQIVDLLVLLLSIRKMCSIRSAAIEGRREASPNPRR